MSYPTNLTSLATSCVEFSSASCVFIDTHCHLDSARYADDIDVILAQAQANGIKAYIIPAASPDTLIKAKELAYKHPYIYMAYGLHPCEINIEADDASAQNLATLEHIFTQMQEAQEVAQYERQEGIKGAMREAQKEGQEGIQEGEQEGKQKEITTKMQEKMIKEVQGIKEAKCVAIGECGLDYYRLAPHISQKRQKDLQAEAFIMQINKAIEKDLPLIVHVREASNDVYEILSHYKKARGVLHCYNADEILLKLSDRFYYGIGGVATFTNAKRLLKVLPNIPLNRLVLETDSPYLAPHPYRGTRNTPAHIPLIASKVAQILGLELEQIARISTDNARALFSLSSV